MKKLSVILIVSVVLGILLTSCGSNGEFTLEIPHTDIKGAEDLIIETVNSWLDENGFEKALSEREFMDFLNTVTYEGKKLSEYASALSYDTDNGHGLMGSGEFVNYESNYFKDPITEIETIYNSLTFTADIEGLELPFEIDLGDELMDTLKRLSKSVPELSTILEESVAGGVVLWKRDNVWLKFSNAGEDGYIVEFHETKMSEGAENEGIKLERTILFSFSLKDTALNGVTVTAKETR